MEETIAQTAPVRLVAIDLDGTLLTDSKRISRRTIDALRKLAQGPVQVILASARPPRGVRPIHAMLELKTLQINHNGALVWDEMHHQASFHQPIAGTLGQQIVESARNLFEEVAVGYEVLDRCYTDPSNGGNGRGTPWFGRHEITPLEDFIDLEPTRIDLRADPSIITRVEPWLKLNYGSRIGMHRPTDSQLQIMDRRTSKATALRHVCDTHGIELNQVMAIGDAPNDVAMLQIAGIAVAMDNAHPRVKEVADWVAPSNNDHGVCAALRRYGLCE